MVSFQVDQGRVLRVNNIYRLKKAVDNLNNTYVRDFQVRCESGSSETEMDNLK